MSSREERKVKKMMVERAEEAIEEESEDIKDDLESGRMKKFDKRKIKDRLESVAEDAIEEVRNEVTGALVSGVTKLGEEFYPVISPSLVFVVDDVIAGLAAAAALAAIGAMVSPYTDEINSWWEDKLERQRELEVAGAKRFKEMAGIEDVKDLERKRKEREVFEEWGRKDKELRRRREEREYGPVERGVKRKEEEEKLRRMREEEEEEFRRMREEEEKEWEERGEEIEEAEADVRRQSMDLKDELDDVAEDLRGISLAGGAITEMISRDEAERIYRELWIKLSGELINKKRKKHPCLSSGSIKDIVISVLGAPVL